VAVRRTILFLHGTSGLYGADRQLLTIATRLDRSRFTALVVVSERDELAKLLEEAGVETQVVPLAVLRRELASGRGLLTTIGKLAENRRALARLATRRWLSLVHTNSSILLPGQAFANAIGVPHLVGVREIYTGLGSRAADRVWPLLRRRLLGADALACVSEAVMAQFAGSARAFVLYDGLDPIVPTPREEARRALGLPQERFTAAVVGRISDWKGQTVLAEALARPPLTEIGAIGLVAGEAAPRQEHHRRALEDACDRAAFGDRLRLLGYRRDIETVLGAADAVVVPSTYADPLPNTALEGASAGLPVVASAVGGLPEIVRDGVTGRLVPPRDADALAQALRGLADDPGLRARLGAAGAADVRARFGTERMMNELQACYDRLIQAR
jgi:glycosyltransferase involved in cell wall biosynthesis